MPNAIAPGMVIANEGLVIIRGYTVSLEVAYFLKLFQLQICGFENISQCQFRWLQTARINAGGGPQDLWILDEIEISYQEQGGESQVLLKDSFDANELK